VRTCWPVNEVAAANTHRRVDCILIRLDRIKESTSGLPRGANSFRVMMPGRRGTVG